MARIVPTSDPGVFFLKGDASWLPGAKFFKNERVRILEREHAYHKKTGRVVGALMFERDKKVRVEYSVEVIDDGFAVLCVFYEEQLETAERAV
jgi:hypothetical protein